MTNQQILTKAIETTLSRGYVPDGIQNITSFKATIRNGQAWVRWFNNAGQEVIQEIEHVIYNHDFAKSLWGDKYGVKVYAEIKIKEGVNAMYSGKLPLWQYQLQQMVIAEDPIKYLGEHL